MLKKLSKTQAAIRPIEIDGERVVFLSDTAHSPGDILRLAAGEVLTVEGGRSSETGDDIYWGSLSSPGYEVFGVESDGGDRSHPRVAVCLKARSPSLPNFAAVTENLSPYGACLRAVGPLTPGEQLTLTFEDTNFEVSGVESTVRWSSLTEPFLAGVSFDQGRESQLELLLGLREEQAGIVDLRPAQTEVWRFPSEGELIKVDTTPSLLNLTVRSGGHYYLFSFENATIVQENLGQGILASVSRVTLAEGDTRVRFFDLTDQPLLDVVCTAYRALCSLARAG